MYLDVKIPMTKSDGCIIINAKDWQDNNSQVLQIYNMKGEKSISCLNKVIDVNCLDDIYYEKINKGDLVFITRTASRISYLKPYKIPKTVGDFANVHLLQVIGKFKDNVVSLENFTPIYDKVFMEPVAVKYNSLLYADNSSTTVGKVLKVGKGGFNPDWSRRDMKIKVGQTVLLRDNITTSITIEGKDYIATEDSMVVGYFENDIIDMNHLKVYNDSIILESYQEEKIQGSSLFKPVQQDDITELYSQQTFKVVKVSENVKDIEEEDKVLVDPINTNYITFMNQKYFILNSKKDLIAKFN